MIPTEQPTIAAAVMALGMMPINFDGTDINMLHVRYGHTHAALLCKTARRLGLTLTGELRSCTGCSMAKGIERRRLRKPCPVRLAVGEGICGYFRSKGLQSAGGSIDVMNFKD